MDALTPTVVRATTLLLALISLTACGTSINTISLPEKALEARVVPTRHGASNLDVGVYAVECGAALDAREKDIEAIRKAVGQ